jgi:hypothetical protein
MYNVLPLYTFNTYKVVVLHIITLRSHELLQTCDPPSSSSLILSDVLKLSKVTNEVSIVANNVTFWKLFDVMFYKQVVTSLYVMTCLQNWYTHAQCIIYMYILKTTWHYMIKIDFSFSFYKYFFIFINVCPRLKLLITNVTNL